MWLSRLSSWSKVSWLEVCVMNGKANEQAILSGFLTGFFQVSGGLEGEGFKVNHVA